MSSKKDPAELQGGPGQAGSQSVGPNAVTFQIPDGPTATVWLEEVNTDVATIGTLNLDTLVIDDITVTSITAATGTFTTYLATNLIQPESGTSVTVSSDLVVDDDLTANTVTATDTDEGLRAYTISRADGDNAQEITVRSDLELYDPGPDTRRSITALNAVLSGTIQVNSDITQMLPTSTLAVYTIARGPAGTPAPIEVQEDLELVDGATWKNLEAEDLTARGTLSTDTLASQSGTTIETDHDIVGTGDMEGIALSTSLQRYSSLTEAINAVDVTETFVLESYEEGRAFGAEDWYVSAGASSGFAEVIDTDGRYVYTLTSEGDAVALDRETGALVHTYVLTNTFGTSNMGVTTNGTHVAFSFEHHVEVFEVGTPGTAAFTESFDDPSNAAVRSIWLGPDYLILCRGIYAAETSANTVIKYNLAGTLQWSARGLATGVNARGTVATAYEDRVYVLGEEATVRYFTTLDLADGNQIGDEREVVTTSNNPIGITTDGKHVFVTFDSGSGVSEVYAVPMKRDGYSSNTPISWNPVNGEDGSRVALDHRNIYLVNSSNVLTIYDRHTLNVKNSLDLTSVLASTDRVTDVAVDGQTVFLGVPQATTGNPTLARLYLDHDPSVFYKTELDSRRGRIFNHHAVPLEVSDQGVPDDIGTRLVRADAFRFEGGQKYVRSLNIFNHLETVGGFSFSENNYSTSAGAAGPVFNVTGTLGGYVQGVIFTMDNLPVGTLDNVQVAFTVDSEETFGDLEVRIIARRYYQEDGSEVVTGGITQNDYVLTLPASPSTHILTLQVGDISLTNANLGSLMVVEVLFDGVGWPDDFDNVVFRKITATGTVTDFQP